MPVFSYRAIDQRQAAVSGSVAADSPRQARDMLRIRGLTVEEVRPQQVKRQLFGGWFTKRRGNSARLAATVRDLATLLAVGVDLVESLDTISRQHKGYFQTAILMLKDRVAAGAQLADAMGEQPDVFDELTVRMTEVGQNSGTLEQVLDQLADFKDGSLQLKDRVVGALLYPAIILTAALGVTLFLMTVVVPMLLNNLIEVGRELPWPTKVLKAMSDFLLYHGWTLAVALVLGIVLFTAILKTTSGRRLWHRFLLKVPLLGSLISRQALARLAATLATLLRSGVEYLEAAEIASRATGNMVFREALEESGREVQAGADIGFALERTGVFPPLVVHIFTIGQASGQLENMLDRLATDYDRQVTSLSNRLASVLEPILIMVLAVFVGFILFATLLPILEAGNVI